MACRVCVRWSHQFFLCWPLKEIVFPEYISNWSDVRMAVVLSDDFNVFIGAKTGILKGSFQGRCLHLIFQFITWQLNPPRLEFVQWNNSFGSAKHSKQLAHAVCGERNHLDGLGRLDRASIADGPRWPICSNLPPSQGTPEDHQGWVWRGAHRWCC